jgi:hypothetical protein
MIGSLSPDAAARERQREATAQFARLNGPRELHAAVLALLLPPAPCEQAMRLWQIETESIPGSAALTQQVADLGGALRLPCFEQLLARMARQPLASRQALLEATRRLMRATGTVRPVDRLHWLTMRLRLGEQAFFGARTTSGDLPQVPESDVHAIARFSAYLSRMVPAADALDAGAAWYATVMAPWQPRGIVPPLQWPDTDLLVHSLQELQALAWMHRPVLVRGWLRAALQHSRHGRLADSAADALYLCCALLDSPLPPELARHHNPALREPLR